jgi:hypothetical protein
VSNRIQVPDSQTLLNSIHPGWYRNIQLANWGWRMLSLFIDYFVVPFPFILILGGILSPRAMWITVYVIWWLNSALLQGHTSQ